LLFLIYVGMRSLAGKHTQTGELQTANKQTWQKNRRTDGQWGSPSNKCSEKVLPVTSFPPAPLSPSLSTPLLYFSAAGDIGCLYRRQQFMGRWR